MKKTSSIFSLCIICGAAMADDLSMNAALRATYTNCVGIDNALHDMKVRAGINTAVSGVGTGLGIGATAVGIAKAKTDAMIEEKFKRIDGWAYTASGNVETASNEDFLASMKEMTYNVRPADDEDIQESEEKQRLTAKSKKLGNWRTGLLVGNTITNLAGATISGANKVEQPLQEQIQNCVASVKVLRGAIMQARLNQEDVSEAEQIESACSGFEYVDVSKINDRAKGALVSSVVGAGTGVVGVITSALANSDKVRNVYTEQGKKKEKNLNTTANILSAGSTVASASATVFSASQIKEIKKAAEVAQKCTGVLK